MAHTTRYPPSLVTAPEIEGMGQVGAQRACGHCGTVNAAGEQYCSDCGYLLSAGPVRPIIAGTVSTSNAPVAGTPGFRRITGMLKTGETLGSRYRIVRLVGKGGFGAVYEAHDERFQSRRAIALKEMSDAGLSVTERARAIRDFRHEADLLVQLTHPNLPNVSDFFEEESRAYLVMEFIQGDTLEKVQENAGGPLDEKNVMDWAVQLCDVLSYLHTRPQPIIFRDMKPTNVMLTSAGQIKLIDFGIARIFKSTANKDTNSLGSWGYSPLEQYGRGQSDARSDIYALGATLYDLLTKTTPLDAPGRVLNPQFFQPPRQLNPRISESTERIVLKAMEQDPKNRFQTATEMLQAIAGSGIVPHAKGSHPVPSPVPTQSNKPLPVRKPAAISHFTGRRPWLIVASLFVALVLLIALIPRIFPGSTFNSPSIPAGIGANGIGTYTVNGEEIGISDGKYALDTKSDRKGREYKIQAANSLRAGNISAAISQWRQDSTIDTNDAEPLIYLEDQRVLASGGPYITFVVGVLLGTNTFDGYSRDYLQAAYIAQKEYNDHHKLPGNVNVRLLIAKSGSDSARSTEIARQIVKAAQYDKTIVGVLGWTTSATSVDTISVLAQNHIPMVAAGVATDELTNISPYFFRVGPPNKITVKLLASYVETRLNPKHLVIFRDSHDPYSQSLAEDFARQFTNDGYGNRIAYTQEFKAADKPVALSQTVKDVLHRYSPDVILFTSINVEDMFTLLNTIPSTSQFANLKVVMGIAGYEITETGRVVPGYNRLRFSTAAFPDEWAAYGEQEPAFFREYAATFDPQGTHPGVYTFSRPNSFVMLGYDAMLTLLAASQIALRGGKNNFTPDQLREALTQIKGSQAIQGVTGQISLGADGDPINKVNFVLRVDANNHLHIDAAQGCFFNSATCNNAVKLSN